MHLRSNDYFRRQRLPTAHLLRDGTLINWFDEICASFDLVDGRRISNGPVEGINSRIDKILSNACGYQKDVYKRQS